MQLYYPGSCDAAGGCLSGYGGAGTVCRQAAKIRENKDADRIFYSGGASGSLAGAGDDKSGQQGKYRSGYNSGMTSPYALRIMIDKTPKKYIMRVDESLSKRKKRLTIMEEKTVTPVRQLCFIALMAGIMCLLGPLSIPIGPVPISVMTLTIYLSLYVVEIGRAHV